MNSRIETELNLPYTRAIPQYPFRFIQFLRKRFAEAVELKTQIELMASHTTIRLRYCF